MRKNSPRMKINAAMSKAALPHIFMTPKMSLRDSYSMFVIGVSLRSFISSEDFSSSTDSRATDSAARSSVTFLSIFSRQFFIVVLYRLIGNDSKMPLALYHVPWRSFAVRHG